TVDGIDRADAAHRLEFFGAGTSEHRLAGSEVGEDLVAVDADTGDLAAAVTRQAAGHAHTARTAAAGLAAGLAAAVQTGDLRDRQTELTCDLVQTLDDLIVNPFDYSVDGSLDRRLQLVERADRALTEPIPGGDDSVLDLDGLVPDVLESATQRREHAVTNPVPAGAQLGAHRVPRVDGDILEPDRDTPQDGEEPLPRLNDVLPDPRPGRAQLRPDVIPRRNSTITQLGRDESEEPEQGSPGLDDVLFDPIPDRADGAPDQIPRSNNHILGAQHNRPQEPEPLDERRDDALDETPDRADSATDQAPGGDDDILGLDHDRPKELEVLDVPGDDRLDAFPRDIRRGLNEVPRLADKRPRLLRVLPQAAEIPKQAHEDLLQDRPRHRRRGLDPIPHGGNDFTERLAALPRENDDRDERGDTRHDEAERRHLHDKVQDRLRGGPCLRGDRCRLGRQCEPLDRDDVTADGGTGHDKKVLVPQNRRRESDQSGKDLTDDAPGNNPQDWQHDASDDVSDDLQRRHEYTLDGATESLQRRPQAIADERTKLRQLRAHRREINPRNNPRNRATDSLNRAPNQRHNLIGQEPQKRLPHRQQLRTDLDRQRLDSASEILPRTSSALHARVSHPLSGVGGLRGPYVLVHPIGPAFGHERRRPVGVRAEYRRQRRGFLRRRQPR